MALLNWSAVLIKMMIPSMKYEQSQAKLGRTGRSQNSTPLFFLSTRAPRAPHVRYKAICPLFLPMGKGFGLCFWIEQLELLLSWSKWFLKHNSFLYWASNNFEAAASGVTLCHRMMLTIYLNRLLYIMFFLFWEKEKKVIY